MNGQNYPMASRSPLRERPFGSALIALTLTLLVPGITFAHGVVGNRIFLSPIVGNDAFPDNAFDLTVRRSDCEFSLLPELEKQLSDNSSLLFTGGWVRVSAGVRQQATTGSTDLSIYFRQAVLKSARDELEFTVSSLTPNTLLSAPVFC